MTPSAGDTWYVILSTDPVLARPAQWGRRTQEIVETCTGEGAEEQARALHAQMKAGLRWAGSPTMSYAVSQTPPPPEDPTPLAPFDPGYAGESLEEEEGLAGFGDW